MTSNIGLCVKNMAVFSQLVEYLIIEMNHDLIRIPLINYHMQSISNNAVFTNSFLFVGKDNVSMVGLYHQKGLAQCTRPFAQDLVRFHWDDSTQGKYEGMDILHVQVVCGHSIGH